MIIIQDSNLDYHMFFFTFALEGLQFFTGPLYPLASFFDTCQSLEAFHMEKWFLSWSTG